MKLSFNSLKVFSEDQEKETLDVVNVGDGWGYKTELLVNNL